MKLNELQLQETTRSPEWLLAEELFVKYNIKGKIAGRHKDTYPTTLLESLIRDGKFLGKDLAISNRNVGATIDFPVDMRESHFEDSYFARATFKDYGNLPTFELFRAANTDLALGFGEFAAEKIGSIWITDCTMYAADFEKIIESGKEFTIYITDRLFALGDGTYTSPSLEEDGSVFKTTDIFEYQDYLISNDILPNYFRE